MIGGVVAIWESSETDSKSRMRKCVCQYPLAYIYIIIEQCPPFSPERGLDQHPYLPLTDVETIVWTVPAASCVYCPELEVHSLHRLH